VCAAFEPHELDRINAIATRVRLEAEQAVFYEWDPAEHVFNVTEGVVRLSKMLQDGRRQVTGFLFPGDFLGIAYADTYAYTAEAVCPVALCRFPRRALEALCRDFSELERRILGMASNEIAEAQEQILMLGRKTASEKLASFLCRLAALSERLERPCDTIDLPMNRTDIADYLGLTTETVSRTFSHLAKQGLLDLASAQHVILRQRDKLVALAERFT
jgi:CRP/FNR family transcriptional regulator